MGREYRPLRPLAGIDISRYSLDELKEMVAEILERKIHGICFSPYIEGQRPGDPLSDAQIRARLQIVQPYVNWIRTFSCSQDNERIPAIAKEMGLKTLVGVWLGEDREMNELELANALEIARAGHADLLGVGNEVLLREELPEDELIDYITRAKQGAPGVSVGYVDAYYLFAQHPRVSDACDVIFTNCYPFWEGYPAEHALIYMKEMYRIAVGAGKGKKVIISETGWPDRGTPFRASAPSYENAIRYFINAYQWAEEEGVEIFYFSAFDESWKVADEGDVGAYWGLWDGQDRLKYV
ncbi:MAG: glycosyl hydrolase [Caldilineae bacterium]|nr:MAG: glycosyl hydrolase [Caldilineae bacterium]